MKTEESILVNLMALLDGHEVELSTPHRRLARGMLTIKHGHCKVGEFRFSADIICEITVRDDGCTHIKVKV